MYRHGAQQQSVAQLADRGLVGSLVILRSVVATQVALAATDGLASTKHTAGYCLALAAFFTVSTALVVTAARPRWRRAAQVLSTVDLAIAMALLVFLPALLPVTEVVGTWDNWAPAYALNALLATWILLPRWLGSVGGALVGIVYLVVGGTTADREWGTVLANAATYPGLGIGATWFVAYLRRVGEEADLARQEAVDATRELEAERYRLSVHDTTSLLSQLAAPATPPDVRDALRRQALEESRRLRAYVEAVDSPDASAGTLGAVLDAACRGFEDLGIIRNSDLGDDQPLAECQAEALVPALRTLLHNIRRHSGARNTWLHAEAVDDRWEVVVRDDGRGFEDSTPWGFGLRVQVHEALERVGVATHLVPTPGDGTTVTLTGGRT